MTFTGPRRVRSSQLGFTNHIGGLSTRGQAIGFRKITADKGYWIARRRPDVSERSKKYEYERLGEDSKASDGRKRKLPPRRGFNCAPGRQD